MEDVTQLLNAIDQGDPGRRPTAAVVYEECAGGGAEAGPGAAGADAATHGPGPRSLPASGRQGGRAALERPRPLLAAAAEAMRRSSLNGPAARDLKRGGDRSRQDSTRRGSPRPRSGRLLALDEALDNSPAEIGRRRTSCSSAISPGLRFRSGAGLGISPRTAGRLWVYARAWLRHARSKAPERAPTFLENPWPSFVPDFALGMGAAAAKLSRGGLAMTEQTVLLAVLEIADPAERLAYLERACAADAPLRRQVEVLLAAHEAPASSWTYRPSSSSRRGFLTPRRDRRP